jgi:hypothetical protein
LRLLLLNEYWLAELLLILEISTFVLILLLLGNTDCGFNVYSYLFQLLVTVELFRFKLLRLVRLFELFKFVLFKLFIFILLLLFKFKFRVELRLGLILKLALLLNDRLVWICGWFVW